MNNPLREKSGLNIVVLVSGRGSNLQALLDAQADGRLRSRVSLVISNKAGAPALERARQANLDTRVVASQGRANEDFFAELEKVIAEAKPDLIVLAGFMKILPVSLVKAYEGRMINIHPSLLPAFPGLAAQSQALAAGVKITGCTVHFVDSGCDTGPILLQRTEPVYDDDTPESLSGRLLKREHESLVEAVRLIEDGKVVLQGCKTLLRDHDR